MNTLDRIVAKRGAAHIQDDPTDHLQGRQEMGQESVNFMENILNRITTGSDLARILDNPTSHQQGRREVDRGSVLDLKSHLQILPGHMLSMMNIVEQGLASPHGRNTITEFLPPEKKG